jgi:2-dehydropantoate 2-reductase
MMDLETARSESTLSKVAKNIKQNIHLVEQAGIQVTPPETKSMGELPESDIIASFRKILSNDFYIDVKLGSHAVSQKSEILLLDEVFHKKMKK